MLKRKTILFLMIFSIISYNAMPNYICCASENKWGSHKVSENYKESNEEFFNNVKRYLESDEGSEIKNQGAELIAEFLNSVDMDALYNDYISSGGRKDDISGFAQYVMVNAPFPSDWIDILDDVLRGRK